MEYGKKGTFLIREHCLNSFTWRSPAQPAKPKVCLYHRNPLNNHGESWEFNLSQYFLSSFLCFVSFLHHLSPKSCAGLRLQRHRKESHRARRERRRSTKSDNATTFRSPLSRLFHVVGNVCLSVCLMVEIPPP